MHDIKESISSNMVGRGARSKIYLKVVLPALVSVLIFGLTVFFFIQPHIESMVLDARRELIRGISQTGWSMIDNEALQVDMGGMDRAMAQSTARQMLRSFRYGPHGMDYFWVIDLDGKVQVNPFRSDLEGRNALGLHDDKGKFFIKRALEIAQTKGGGFLTYSWRKENSKDFRQKLVYVRLYVPWGWVIGTGVYLDDVEAELHDMLHNLTLVGAGVFLAVLILAGFITLRQVKSERRRWEAESELQETLDKYRAVQAAAPNPLVVYDSEGTAVYINPSFTQIFGWEVDELIGRRIDFVPEEEKPKTLAAINAVYTDPGRSVSFETKRYTKDHKILDVRISAATFRDAHGKPMGMIVNLLDISESKAVERALRLSEQRYRHLFESANDAIIIFEGSSIEDCNHQALEMFGYSRGEFLGPHDDFLSPEKQPDGSDSLTVIQDHLRRAKAGHLLSFEWQYRHKDGSLFDVEMSLQYVDLPGGPRYMSIGRDVTARKRAEAALKESEERLRTVINATPLDIVCFKDAEGRWLEGNNEIVRALGLEGKAYLGKTSAELAEIAYPGARDLLTKAIESDEDAFNSGLVMREELVLYNPAGHARVFDVIRVPLFHDDGRRKGLSVVGRDITERVEAERQRKEMESQLRHSQKMEAIGTLAGGVAHDFNNILTAIIGYTETAMSKAADDDDLRRGLKIVLDSGFRARDLVKQLLTFSRGRETSLQVLDLADVVSETMKLVKAITPSMISVHTATKAEGTVVKADPIQMQQVIMNLCTNAIQAMEEDGGMLRVIIDTLHVAKDVIPPHPNMSSGDYVVMEISDTGPGIDDDTVKNIFDPFFTTKPRDKGTGLGLSVVHGIVTSIEGAVVVDSRPGTGATFRVYLPRSFEYPEADLIGAGESQLPEGRGTLLLVEDEPLVMRVEQEILESLGYEVVAFPSPVEARNYFERDPKRFDLVITDYAMPNMSGLELASSIKEVAPDIPILMCTGYNQNISARELKLFGIDQTLMKPFTALELGRVLQGMLSSAEDDSGQATS